MPGYPSDAPAHQPRGGQSPSSYSTYRAKEYGLPARNVPRLTLRGKDAQQFVSRHGKSSAQHPKKTTLDQKNAPLAAFVLLARLRRYWMHLVHQQYEQVPVYVFYFYQ